MQPVAKSFEFTSYNFNPQIRKLLFNYKIEFSNREPLVFTETIIFPKPFFANKISQKLLDSLLSNLHIVLGVSYYKLYCPPKFKLNVSLSKKQADFWNAVYKKGLGEFFYVNKINFKNLINFPYSNKVSLEPFHLPRKNRVLLGIGGGKDSIVVAELLKENKIDATAMVVETQKKSSIAEGLIQKIGINSLIIERCLDEKIFQEHEGAYNGHVPISAIFAFLGYTMAVICDYSYVIVANEYSSNFGNVKYFGENINHQWSKSLEFEEIFQDYTREFICPDVLYFSLLRPFYEIRIAEMFSKYKKYFPFFTSCNRSFRIKKDRPKTLWCGECAKCAFVFTMLAAFLRKEEVVKIFGKNLFEEKNLLPVFADILGYGKMKPFDCVGTFDEARAAIFLAKNKFKDSLILKTFLSRINNPEKLVEKVFKTNPSQTMPANFKFFGMKNVLILGYGKEGMATKKYINKFYPKIKIGIADKKNGQNYLEKQANFDLVIKTPGISKRFLNVPYTTATNLFFSQIKNKIIGVTGSKGKSTTASLIYFVLKKAGKKVKLLGNIGNPMLNVLMKPVASDEIFVAELSSYQLDDIQYSPDIAVMTNLFPEHMNYHGNTEKYYEAKSKIIKFQNPWNYFVYNESDKKLKTLAREAKAKTVPFDKSINLKGLSYSLIGKHNENNIKAAIAVARILKISDKIIKKAVEEFQSLPHRLEFVGEFRGIKFYDDAISTTPQSTIAALEAIPGVKTIMLGGEDRGYDFRELEKQLKKHKIENIVLFPDSGKRILKKNNFFRVFNTKSMRKAVEFAYKYTPEGSVCLLSTASPSYSLWKNFEEKGDEFKKAVGKLK
ncbi:MAG TPA: UDP-N-acetylmuramoyl-L-alanine--D-glutamate ligase [Candidatus Moranbacteria bacterium]|nr:UDP-N-acetylmuramoyl-L-alanine--D-glutamate ligase [Candidatus Moranbacteria bacterium]